VAGHAYIAITSKLRRGIASEPTPAKRWDRRPTQGAGVRFEVENESETGIPPNAGAKASHQARGHNAATRTQPPTGPPVNHRTTNGPSTIPKSEGRRQGPVKLFENGTYLAAEPPPCSGPGLNNYLQHR